MSLDILGVVARRQGHYHRARALHEEGLAASQSLGDNGAYAVTMANLGHVARVLGDEATAQARYLECLRIARQVGDRRGAALALGNLGVLAEMAGDLASARAYLDESLAIGRIVEDKRLIAGALRPRAQLALMAGDLSAAVAYHAETMRLAGELQDRRGVGETLSGCAEVLVAQARPDLARELRALAAALQDDRALSVAPIVAQALALLEVRPSPSTRPAHPGGDAGPLSRREREIAQLLTRGLTNRAIAEELIIAERTVDTHVSNILGKLGLATRAQVAAWVEREGLT